MKTTKFLSEKIKVRKQKKKLVLTDKVKNGKEKKNSKLKISLSLKRSKKHHPENLTKDANSSNSSVVTFKSCKPKSNPLDSMLANCSFELSQQSTSIDDFIPNITETQCSVNLIDYQVPLPETNSDYDDDMSELGSSDLGSLVDSVEPASPKYSSSSEEEEEEEIFRKHKVGEFQHYQIPTGAILLLYGNSTIFMHGLTRVNVLHGSVHILGKHLDKVSPPAMVYSPRGSAYLSIDNLNINEKPEDKQRKQLKKRLIHLGIEASVSSDIAIYKLKAKTAVLHCENVIGKATEFLELNLAQKIYPKFHNGLRCTIKNFTSEDWNMLRINPEWDNLLNLINNLNPSDQGMKFMLCGGKGVGKSTLLRYLVNKMLNTREEVYVLDLDPGQPEFTVPGAISLVRVTTPLLGPNYTHLQETERTIFVPSINISSDHESYIGRVRELLNFLPESKMILVNYMGFTKGIGIFLTAMILKLLQADIVVQIESQNESRNFLVDLTPDAVREQLLKSGGESVVIKDYKLVKIDSVAKCNFESVGWELEPRQVREMCILAYMSRVLSGNCKYLTEKDVLIHQISLEDINVFFNDKPCDPSAANGNIVALCSDDHHTCLGWGIVRGICRINNYLLLLTPVSEEKLEQVKDLVVGSVTLPPTIYLRHHDAIRGLVPYTFRGELSNFARTPKRNIMYKQQGYVK